MKTKNFFIFKAGENFLVFVQTKITSIEVSQC